MGFNALCFADRLCGLLLGRGLRLLGRLGFGIGSEGIEEALLVVLLVPFLFAWLTFGWVVFLTRIFNLSIRYEGI